MSAAPTRYAAFLRGMNLGGRRLGNEALRAAVESLGFTEVAAFLASGNLALTASGEAPREIARRLEEGLATALGYPVPTYVRSAAEVHAIAGRRPFPPAAIARTAGKLQVALLAAAPAAAARRAVLALATDDDRLAFGPRELYWLPREGVAQSELDWRRLEAALGPTTVRIRRTVERMAAKLF
jgi:uncharacterized protein (DUF1697 family)